MKTQEQKDLEFKIHRISDAIENLRYSMIYNDDLNAKVTQHYICKLNDVIQEYYNNYLQNN